MLKFNLTLTVGIGLSLYSLNLSAEPLNVSQVVSGGAGLVEMPTSRMMPEGEFGFHFSHAYPHNRYVVFAQPLPWLEVLFKYTDIENRLYGPSIAGSQGYKDKSTDVKVRLLKESYYLPALSVGVRDVGGTGLFSSEYVVASKQFNRFDLTLGLGWGYLGNQAHFANPLCKAADRFCTRDFKTGTPGNLGLNNLFSGESVALFGGVEYHQETMPLTWKLEYDANNYQNEPQNNNLEQETPFNLGLVYSYSKGVNFHLGYVRGNTAMLGLTLKTNIKNDNPPKFFDPLPEPVKESSPMQSVSTVDWEVVQLELKEKSGFKVDSIYQLQNEVVIKGRQQHYVQEAKGQGRASRVLSNQLPKNIERFTFVDAYKGVDVSSTSINREAFAAAVHLEQPQEVILETTQFESIKPVNESDKVFETQDGDFDYQIYPGFSGSYGGPEEFVLYQLSLNAGAHYHLRNNTWLTGGVQLGLIDNYDKFSHKGASDLPRVRTDIKEYLGDSKLRLYNLQLVNIESGGKDFFFMGYAGYLELMYGGVGGEMLYRPLGKNWALGLDVNYVQQRDFDARFGFRDYETFTGHLSGYYETDDHLMFKVSAGQYLAKDRGVTVDVGRKFRNGAKLGFWATKTNVSAEEFGEGSFDKGFYMHLPFNVFSFKSTNKIAKYNFQFLTRDGGQKLNRSYELYDLTHTRSLNTMRESFQDVLR